MSDYIDSHQAADLLGFKSAQSFNLWRRLNNGLPEAILQVPTSAKGKNKLYYLKKDILYWKNERNNILLNDPNIISSATVLKIMNMKSNKTLISYINKHPEDFDIVKIMYKGKWTNFYKRDNIMKISEKRLEDARRRNINLNPGELKDIIDKDVKEDTVLLHNIFNRK